MIQIKRIPQTVQAPRKNARPAKIGNMQMDPMKMFPTNQPPTLLRVQPEMQYAPMRGSMYPMPIPKLHRTTEKSFPPPCPFILRSARNVDAPMYLAARQTQWSNIRMNPIPISRSGNLRTLCVSPEIILIMLPESKKWTGKSISLLPAHFFNKSVSILTEEQFLHIFHRHILTCVQFKCCNTLP